MSERPSFIAIDVETANNEPSSICSIAAVKVVDGEIVDSRYTLINPEPNYYTYFCTRVHGLTDADTWNAPSFGTIWREWEPWLRGFRLVAHNAAFDSKCIAEACRVYRLEPPSEPWLCTLRSARRQIPRQMLPSKRLPSVCEFFGVPFDNHHNALADALGCAKIGIVLLCDEL